MVARSRGALLVRSKNGTISVGSEGVNICTSKERIQRGQSCTLSKGEWCRLFMWCSDEKRLRISFKDALSETTKSRPAAHCKMAEIALSPLPAALPAAVAPPQAPGGAAGEAEDFSEVDSDDETFDGSSSDSHSSTGQARTSQSE